MPERIHSFIQGIQVENADLEHLNRTFSSGLSAFETCLSVHGRLPLARFHADRLRACMMAHGISHPPDIWQTLPLAESTWEKVRLSYGITGGRVWWQWTRNPLPADPRVFSPLPFVLVRTDERLPRWKYSDRSIYDRSESGNASITLVGAEAGPLEGTRHALVAIQDDVLFMLPKEDRLWSVGESALITAWGTSGRKTMEVASLLPYQSAWFVVNALRGLAPLEGTIADSGVGIAGEMWDF